MAGGSFQADTQEDFDRKIECTYEHLKCIEEELRTESQEHEEAELRKCSAVGTEIESLQCGS